MLPALIRAACTRRTAVRVIRVAALISIRPRARSLWMVLRMILWMRCLHALLPELRRPVGAPSTVKPLRRRRPRA